MLDYLDSRGVLQEQFIKEFVNHVGSVDYRSHYPTEQQSKEDLAMWCGFPL